MNNSTNTRLIVLSDSHGKFSPLEQIVLRHKANADLFIHLGDGMEEWEQVGFYYPEIARMAVRGNCDFCSPEDAEQLIILGGKRIFFTHGHLYGVKGGTGQLLDAAKEKQADLVLFGHTHEAMLSHPSGELYFMNPGSVARPRSGHASYGVIDITANGVIVANLAKL